MWMHWAYKYLELYWSVCLQYWLVTGVTTKLNTTINQEMKISGQLRILNHKFSKSKKVSQSFDIEQIYRYWLISRKKEIQKVLPTFCTLSDVWNANFTVLKDFLPLDLKKLLEPRLTLWKLVPIFVICCIEINCTKRPFSFQLWKKLFISFKDTQKQRNILASSSSL